MSDNPPNLGNQYAVWSKNSFSLAVVEIQENTKPFSIAKRFDTSALFTVPPDERFTPHRSRRPVVDEWRKNSLIVVCVIRKFLKFEHKTLPVVARDRRFLERFVHIIQMRFGDLPMTVAIINKTCDEGIVKLLCLPE